ncbi:MAG: O-antigen ligase family protein, partial [Planctomycetota bacterium]
MPASSTSPEPSSGGARLLALLAALALLAWIPGLFTRGDVLRGGVVAFLAAAAAALAALAPAAPRLGGRRLLLLLLPLLVPAAGVLALVVAGRSLDPPALLRLAAPWTLLVVLTAGLLGTFGEGGAPARLVRSLLVAGALAGLWVLLDALLHGLPGVGPFGRPGIAGPVLAALLVASVAVFPVRTPRRLPLALAALLAAALVVTLSRTGIVAGLLGLSATLALGARTTSARRWSGRLFALLACAAVLLVALAGSGRLDLAGPGNTVEVRVGLARASLRLVAERPVLGHGLGTFPAEVLRLRDVEEARISRGRRPFVAHDDLLHVATEGGVVAALAFAAWIVGLLVLGLRTR